MGGSILLREPMRVGRIVAMARQTLSSAVPLTVKIRLGYDDPDALSDIVAAVREAGADELAIHARTKFDGYKPPAYWERVKPVMGADEATTLTRINGEIWSVADARRARCESGCHTVMLGRGALAAPDLARRIVADDVNGEPLSWSHLLPFIALQFVRYDASSPRHVGNRTKQWLAYLKRTYVEAEELFSRIRTLHDPALIAEQLGYVQPSDASGEKLTFSSDIERKVVANLPSQPLAHSR